MSRSFLVSALVVLAAALVCVSGSSLDLASPSSLFSADSWPAPSSEMVLPSASSLIDEVNARHREFLMENGATGMTGIGGLTGASSSGAAAAMSSSAAGMAPSSSAAAAPAPSSSAPGVAPSSSAAPQAAASSSASQVAPSSSASSPAAQSSTGSNGEDASSTGPEIDRSQFSKVVIAVLLKFNRTTTPTGLDQAFCDAINEATGFLDQPGRAMTCSHIYLLADGTVIDPSTTAGRRLLATTVTEETLQMRTTFYPTNDADTGANVLTTKYAAQLACEPTVDPNTGLEDPNSLQTCRDNNRIDGHQSVFERLAASPIGAAIAAAVVPGAVESTTTPGTTSGANTASEGTARGTNAGYYVLGAVVLAFLFAAIIYFTVHKAPVAAKEIDGAPARRGEEVAMEEIPRSAAAPAAGTALVAGDDAGQMDYKSVFALKHNVLDKKDADEPADDNDVHFVLHQ